MCDPDLPISFGVVPQPYFSYRIAGHTMADAESLGQIERHAHRWLRQVRSSCESLIARAHPAALVGQAEDEETNVAGDGDVLLASDDVAHRRSAPGLVEIDVPQLLAGRSVERDEATAILAGKD